MVSGTSLLALRIRSGVLEIEPGTYRARLDGAVLPLPPSQFELLVLLVANRERVVTRSELACAGGLHDRSVDVALSSLRRAVGCDFIRNVRNRGWIVEPDE